MSTVEAYPLHWPEYRQRTLRPQDSAFKVTLADARDKLINELKLLKASNVILSSNLMLRRDGLPLAKQRIPDDVGIAVYFQYKGNQMCFACDKYNQVYDNIQAIRKTIGALRGIARWGTGDMMEQAFKGFEALPDHTQQSCWDILRIKPDSSKAEITIAYRGLASTTHPDKGGSNEEFTKVHTAYQEAMKGK